MHVAVIGSGSWGTAISQILADGGHHVVLKCRSEQVAQHINEHHKNPNYLKNAQLSEGIWATTSFSEAFEKAEACAIVTPSRYLRETAHAFAEHLSGDVPVINCSKGVEAGTGKLASEILEDELGNKKRIAVLAGPTHAEEVIEKLPSGAVCASSYDTAKFFCDLFANDYFRTYLSTDIIGVELCAAFKNVIAIAVGISYGLGNGDNTASILITRGIAEMGRMVVACGGNAITCMGLAGTGDMVVTCMSRHSRNRRFGEDYVAKGKTLSDFEADTHMVVEGALACRTLDTLSKRYNVDLPLTDAVRSIVWEGASPESQAQVLIGRPLKKEFYGI